MRCQAREWDGYKWAGPQCTRKIYREYELYCKIHIRTYELVTAAGDAKTLDEREDTHDKYLNQRRRNDSTNH